MQDTLIIFAHLLIYLYMYNHTPRAPDEDDSGAGRAGAEPLIVQAPAQAAPGLLLHPSAGMFCKYAVLIVIYLPADPL